MPRRAGFLLAAVLLANVISPALLAGIPSKKAVYRGGTLSTIRLSTAGAVTTTDSRHFVFRHEKGELRIRYDSINSLEYGQKSARRLGLAIAISPLFLLTKKRNHYLTLSFFDAEGNQQAVVLELGKKIVRTTLAGLSARSGLKVEFENEKAREALSQ